MNDALYEFMQDFDNSELSNYDRDEQLRESIEQYNQDNGTKYGSEYVRNYKSWLMDQYRMDQ